MNFKSGQAVLIASIFFLITSVTVIFGMAIPVSKQIKITSDLSKSRESFFLAESGIEDVIYRLKNGFEVSDSEEIEVNGYSASISTEDTAEGKLVMVVGNVMSYFKNIEIEIISGGGSSASFSYGAHVGDGGLRMENSSKVIGDVFSTGDIGISNSARITGSARVAGSGKKIKDAIIEKSAWVDICENSNILGTLYANSSSGCSFNSFVSLGTPPTPIPLPISQEQIDAWKNEAGEGTIIPEDYSKSSGTHYLGPAKIIGNLTIQNSATLILTGTVWVVGGINVEGSAEVKLDISYGGGSGVIVSDGQITLGNTSVSSGSGQSGSYLMYLSTTSLSPAIKTRNSAKADILYTSSGRIEIGNSVILKTATGYGIDLENSAEVRFESGLLNTVFSDSQGGGSGSGGSFQVSSWKEI